MRVFVALLFFLVVSCASQIVNLGGNRLEIKNNIDIEKAKIIVGKFLDQEKGPRIKGKITIEEFEKEYQTQCNNFAMALEDYGEFCNAQYVISNSNDPLCFGSARVIEHCENGNCEYKFSEFEIICE